MNTGINYRSSFILDYLDVEIEDSQRHFCRGVHVFDVEPLADGVDAFLGIGRAVFPVLLVAIEYRGGDN